MAAPTYATDLADITLCESGTFTEFTGYTAGTLQTVPETDYFLQGSGCVSSTCKTTLNSIGFDYGSGITVPTDGAVFFWQVCWVPNSMNTFANGGQRCFIGTTVTNFKGWISGGSDYPPNPYGGWKNVAIDPTVTNDYTGGTGGTTYNVFGIGLNLPTSYPGKGAMFGMDALRYGRGELRVYNGESGNPATFAGVAAKNDANDATNGYNRWGLFQAIAGGYLWKGLITLGYSAACYFSDSNKTILIDDCPRVGSAFTKLDIKQSGSTVIMTNCSFTALGTTTRGTWVTTDNATVTLTGCVFTDMGTFGFLSNTSALGCTFRRTDQITAPGSDLTGSRVEESRVAADTSAVVWNVATDTDGYLDDMYFSKGANAHHAIELGTSSPTEVTLRGITFSGFNASNAANDSVVHVKRTTGSVVINAVGCSGTVSYKTAGATVSVVVDPVTITVTVQEVDGTKIENARVLVKASDGTGPFPFQETVTIDNTGTTATVTHTGHGMASNDKVLIDGASLQPNNGVFSITYISDNSYSYTMTSDPGGDPTGTIKATFVALSGLTSALGIATTSRVYSADQPITGWARKASGTPYYKTGLISGAVDSADGFSATVLMIEDV